MAVPGEAVARHGKPASIIWRYATARGSMPTSRRPGRGGESAYGKGPAELGIRKVPARARHPQTNGRPERPRGEVQRKMHRFEASSCAGAVNREYVSLDWGNGETPAQAFMRKMAPAG